MDIKGVLASNYLPYAAGTIVSRAIPAIDGFKPAQRRILYTMYMKNLINGGKVKSSAIVGETMKLHPHGDMSIYDTMVHMSSGNESLNVPYIESKGNFGKVYSSDTTPAASRYTEAKLSQVCKEVFDGIKENAVNMIPNFDNSMDEPELLPVKFPSILANPSKGIAVGMGSTIPAFNLINLCKATASVLVGNVKDAESLMGILGVPEYTTGGFIHASKKELIKLGQTGCGSFKISGKVVLDSTNKTIKILEIPYDTTGEQIIDDIKNKQKVGDLMEVSDIQDDTGINGFGLTVILKRNADVHKVVNDLFRMTHLRSTISYNTRVIINNRCEELGLLDLIYKWIEFRKDTLTRVYSYRKEVYGKDEHKLAAWEKLKLNIMEVAKIITDKTEEDARKALMEFYGLDELQADYILDMKIRMFTEDNLKKKLDELDRVRVDLNNCVEILSSDDKKNQIIIDDLVRVAKNYGGEVKTKMADELTAEQLNRKSKKELKMEDDTPVKVVFNKQGYIKRIDTVSLMNDYQTNAEQVCWGTKNNEYVIVFTYSGTVHKVLVGDISNPRNGFKDELYKLAGLNNASEIMYADVSGDWTDRFSIVYSDGRGAFVDYDRVSGNRKIYKSVYEECVPGECIITKSKQFFVLTKKRKAVYVDVTNKDLELFKNVRKFKTGRIESIDRVVAIQPIENVPDISKIDISKYKKGYAVLIKDDKLF